MATHCAARKMRSLAKFIMMARKSPVLFAEQVLHRNAAVLEGELGGVRRPPAHLLELRPTVKPGVPRSMTRSETPPWPGPPVRTAVVTKSARQPEVMKVFEPLTT
jgi:hypothetical protein